MNNKPTTIPGRILPPDPEYPRWNVELERLCRETNAMAARHGRLAVNRKDGTILVRIPAGDFEMGDGKDSNCPKHRVHLSEYWIGVYCVTNRQYAEVRGEDEAPSAGSSGLRHADLEERECPAGNWIIPWCA
jgi:formylglycine-generating enzyme required for sulfatase activity